MNKRTKKRVGAWIAFTVVTLIVLCLIFMLPSVIRNAKEKKAQKLEEERLAELRLQKEEERQFQLTVDEDNLLNESYEAVILSMQGATGWNTSLITDYIGLPCVKAEARLKTAEEFFSMWDNVVLSGNPISYALFIVDPYVLLNDEGDYEIENIFTAYPDVLFRVILTTPTKDVWVKDSEISITNEDGEVIQTIRSMEDTYVEMLQRLVHYENVSLSCYSGENWLAENESAYIDPEEWDIEPSVCPELFLYQYMGTWAVTKDTLPFYEKKLHAMKEPARTDYAMLTDCDVLYIGDSIFELEEGPFSIPSVVSNVCGGTYYNLSKGGITAAPVDTDESNVTLNDLLDCFLGGETPNPDWNVFARYLAEYNQIEHLETRTFIFTDVCCNDYFSAVPLGDTSNIYTFKGALKKELLTLQSCLPNATIIYLLPYNVDLYYHGTYKTEEGYDLSDYRAAVKEVCDELTIPYLDLSKTSGINGYSSQLMLKDGAHPTAKGARACGEAVANYLTENAESFGLEVYYPEEPKKGFFSFLWFLQ